MEEGHTITLLLERWRQGEGQAFNELLPLVYEELRRIAVRHRAAESKTLQPTALVHEAFLRFQAQGGSFEDRNHFYAAAALSMRRLLVDYARHQVRQKRGGGAIHVDLDENLAGNDQPAQEILALDEALDRLGATSQHTLRIVQLRYFGGMTYQEIAGVAGVSTASVGRELHFAKAWLSRELANDGEGQ